MLKQIRVLLNKTNNVTRSSYLWNSINAMLSAAESPVIIAVMTRTDKLRDAGVFSIAYAVASLMLFLGQYGLRRFQSSDIKEKYTFAEYYGMRYLTCIAMMAASLGYCIYGSLVKGYGADKFLVIMLVCFLKCIQAFSDVIHGRMQQKGRLDVATKCSAARYVMEMLVFVIVFLVTRNLVISTISCVLISFIIFMLNSVNAAADYCVLKADYNPVKIKMLLVEGFPLFSSLFLNMYLSNAPKYAIDTYLSDEIQAIYNLIFMPAFVVQIIAHFIFNPILTTYAEVWTAGDIKKLKKLILRQMGVVLGLTLLGLAVAATIGIPVLSILFGVDLSSYKKELCIVMVGGGMLAYSVFFNTVITIIRLHNTLVVCYGVAAVAAFLLSGYAVRHYGMLGAAGLYAVIMSILALLLGAILCWGIMRKKAPVN